MNVDEWRARLRIDELREKVRGAGQAPPGPYPTRSIVLAVAGAMIAIGLVAAITQASDELFIMASFGASCVLVFGFPDLPFSQPRNVVGGHVLSTFAGLVLMEFSRDWWAVALAVGAAIALMMVTRTVHPPAGSNPVIVVLGVSDWDFLFLPTLVGAILIVLVALVYNNLTREGRYPAYW